MTKLLTRVGNSNAVIIPKKMIDKYAIGAYSLEETEKGILIIPSGNEKTFQHKLSALKAQKKKLYKLMEEESEDSETIEYYKNNLIEDIDLDIIDS